jgi:hypothetical protein
MKAKSAILSLNVGVCLLLLCPPAFAHHSAFCRDIFQAVEKADLATVKDLFDEAVWKRGVGAMSAKELQERLTHGKLIPLHKSSDSKLQEHASTDKFDSRLRCVITFKVEHEDDAIQQKQVFLLAKRVGNDGYSNPKAWRIWRIVVDRDQAECFLGRKLANAK